MFPIDFHSTSYSCQMVIRGNNTKNTHILIEFCLTLAVSQVYCYIRDPPPSYYHQTASLLKTIYEENNQAIILV